MHFRCASLPEKTEIQQSPTTQKSISKSIPFFRKRNKDDKQKNNRINSPLKDSDSIDSITSSKTIVQSAATTTTKNSIDPDANDSHDSNKKNQINEKTKKLQLDFFTEDFEGITVSSTKCLSCETVTEQEETMIDISVPITNYENNDRETSDHQFIQVSAIWIGYNF